jgi:enoyl-CoA hydratase/carnithine racemase
MSQTYETLLLEKRERVAIITINRPDKRNALNIKNSRRRRGAVGRTAQRCFRSEWSCSPAPVKRLSSPAPTSRVCRTHFDHAARRDDGPIVVYCGRHFSEAGDCDDQWLLSGGGCELASRATFASPARRRSFGQPEIKLGIIPGGGGTQRLTRLVGEGKAMEMILTGESSTPTRRYHWPGESRCARAQLEAKTMEIANVLREESDSRCNSRKKR